VADPSSSSIAPLFHGKPLATAYLITPDLNTADAAGCEQFVRQLERVLNSGLSLVQLRLSAPTLNALRTLAIYNALLQAVIMCCRQHGAHLLLNSAIDDEALDKATISKLTINKATVPVDGIHLTSSDLMACTHRPSATLVAASCHNALQLLHATQIGVDFVTLSPVLATTSHPGSPALGWSAFAALAARSAVPVYALGGMSPASLEIAQQHGAYGIAAIRALWHDAA
jgi:thiamine-phosphate diphosphorylase